jgi:TonB family protein
LITAKKYTFIKQIPVFFLVILPVLLNFNLSLSAPRFQQETFEQMIQSAQTSIDNKKYKDAKKKLQQALKIRSDSPDAHLLLALVYRYDNHRQESIKQVYEALQTQPENGEAHYLMAVLLYETNEPGQAETELDKAIQYGTQAFNVYTLKGRLAMADRKYKTAIENFEKALQLHSVDKEQVEFIRSQTEALKNYVEFSASIDKSAFTRPKPLNHPSPNYTEDARNNNIQGVVKVFALIDETGKVKSTFLLARLGYGLDEQAILAVSKMKFQAAIYRGAPVPYWVNLDVEFNLRG